MIASHDVLAFEWNIETCCLFAATFVIILIIYVMFFLIIYVMQNTRNGRFKGGLQSNFYENKCDFNIKVPSDSPFQRQNT